MVFKACNVCKGWGIAKDEIGFSMVKCPACDGRCIVDENKEETDDNRHDKNETLIERDDSWENCSMLHAFIESTQD